MRPFSISAKDADLCRRAGFEQSIFTEPYLGPFPNRAAKLRHVRKALIDAAYWRERIDLEILGYVIRCPADMQQARRMELTALQGRWLAEDEDEELESMLVGPAVSDVLEFHGVKR